MTWRQRRAAGVTIRNLVKTAKALKDAGDLEGLSDSEMSAAILMKLVEGNDAVLNDPQFDWDGLLQFLERLLPLILQLIAIFGG